MSDVPSTHPSLLRRMRDLRDRDAWALFIEAYAPAVYGYLRERGLQDAGSDTTIDYIAQLEPMPDRPELLGRFDRFEIVRELGRGVMDVVYEAFDPVLRRTIALKILRLELTYQDKAHSSLLREARATADLCHDHILSPHSIEEHDGVP